MASRIMVAILAAVLAGGVAGAQTPDWELGGRLLSVHAAESTDEVAGLGAALEVDDVHEAADAIKGRGGRILREAGPMNAGTTIIAFVADPDGYYIELIGKR